METAILTGVKKSAGLIRALQFAVPVPAVKQAAAPAPAKKEGDGKNDTAIIIFIGLLVVGVIYFSLNKENKIAPTANQPQAQQGTEKEDKNNVTSNPHNSDTDINQQ